MATIDVIAAAKDHYRRLQRSMDNISVDVQHLKLKICGDPRWSGQISSQSGPLRMVHSESGVTMLSADQSSGYNAKISITYGRVKGLNRSLALKTPDECQPTLPTINFNPSRERSHDEHSLNLTAYTGDIAATSNAEQSKKQFAGEFIIVVEMYGNVVYKGNNGSSFVQDVKDINIAGTQRKGKCRTWQIRGKAEFTYGIDYQLSAGSSCEIQ